MDALSDRTLSALRQQFGAEADAKIADAGALIDRAAERWPDVRRFIDCAGLADNAHLIAYLAERAQYRRTEGARIAEYHRVKRRRLYELRRRSRT